MQRMLDHTIGAADHIRMAAHARRDHTTIIAMSEFSSIPVELCHLVATDTRHATLHPVNVALYTLVLTLVLRAGPPTVALPQTVETTVSTRLLKLRG